MDITIKKTGQTIRIACERRQKLLSQRLQACSSLLDSFISDQQKLKAYLIRSVVEQLEHHPMHFKTTGQITSEEFVEVRELCEEIRALETEIRKLDMLEHHLDDADVYELNIDELIRYGFDTEETF